MPLSKKHTEYTLRSITTITPHSVEIDRVLVNLFAILKYDGKPIPHAFLQRYDMARIRNLVCEDNPKVFKGFSEFSDLVTQWLRSDFFILSNKGKSNEKVACPVPLHLNTYKMRSSNETKDYGLANQIFAMLYYGSKHTYKDLRDFFFEGVNVQDDKFDQSQDVDIETLLVLRMLDNFPEDMPDDHSESKYPVPVCLGQAKILCDDISRLLSFKEVIPRLVLIRHLKNIIALNLGIYVDRLALLLDGYVYRGGSPSACNECFGQITDQKDFQNCPFRPSFITDMGDDHRSHMASLARKQYEDHFIAYSRYVKAHIFVKKLSEYGQMLYERGIIPDLPMNIDEILNIKNKYSGRLDYQAFFLSRNQELYSEAQAVGRNITTLFQANTDEFDKYISMLYELRLSYHLRTFERLCDSLFQKNTDDGFLRSGFGSINKRRYFIGSGLLETLVELSTLQEDEGGKFTPKLIRIDEFIEILKERYGIHIQSLPDYMTASIFDLEALRQNVVNLKVRLRDIGYYQDLSDAFISQTIKSRYMDLGGVI